MSELRHHHNVALKCTDTPLQKDGRTPQTKSQAHMLTQYPMEVVLRGGQRVATEALIGQIAIFVREVGLAAAEDLGTDSKPGGDGMPR